MPQSKEWCVFFAFAVCMLINYQIFYSQQIVDITANDKLRSREARTVTSRNKTTCMILREQKKRLLTLKQFCMRMMPENKKEGRRVIRLRSPLSVTNNMLFNRKQGYIYCLVPKTGSTNWKKVMLVMDGQMKNVSDRMNENEFNKWRLIKSPIRERERMKASYYSFFFVRHPFERLLASYRNKLKAPFHLQYQHKVGSDILRLFRKNLTKQDYRKGQNVTFLEFINYIIHQYESKGYDALDEHWQSMLKLCSPCSIKYDYIGKMETLQEDADQIIKDLGFSQIVEYPTAKATDRYKVKTRQIMKEHYASIPTKTLNKLYEIYKNDFTAFGYKKNEYF